MGAFVNVMGMTMFSVGLTILCAITLFHAPTPITTSTIPLLREGVASTIWGLHSAVLWHDTHAVLPWHKVWWKRYL